MKWLVSTNGSGLFLSGPVNYFNPRLGVISKQWKTFKVHMALRKDVERRYNHPSCREFALPHRAASDVSSVCHKEVSHILIEGITLRVEWSCYCNEAWHGRVTAHKVTNTVLCKRMFGIWIKRKVKPRSDGIRMEIVFVWTQLCVFIYFGRYVST